MQLSFFGQAVEPPKERERQNDRTSECRDPGYIYRYPSGDDYWGPSWLEQSAAAAMIRRFSDAQMATFNQRLSRRCHISIATG